jgi:hypothetical protein
MRRLLALVLVVIAADAGPAAAQFERPGYVSMMEWPGQGDEGLAALRGRPDVKALSMQKRTLGPTTRDVLPTLKNLRWLNLTEAGATDDDLKAVASLPDLETLYLPWAKVTDGGMKHLAGLPKLKELHLSYTAVSDDGVRTLAASKSLEFVVLLKTKVTDDALKHLRGMKSLRRLDVAYTAVTAKGLANLAGAKLDYLRIPDEVKTPEALPHYLSALAVPKVLSLEGWAVDDAGLAEVARHEGVTWLIASGPFTDAGAKHVAGMAELTNLNLNGPKLTAAGARHLASLPKLRSLGLGSSDDAVLAEVGKMTDLTYLSLEGEFGIRRRDEGSGEAQEADGAEPAVRGGRRRGPDASRRAEGAEVD